MELKSGECITKGQIQEMVERVADQIFKDYGNEELVIIILLNGGMYFAVDLSRALERRRTMRRLYIDTMSVSSWPFNNQPSDEIRILKDISYQINGRHVLVVDEVADTRRTLEAVKKHLWVKNPKSLKVAVAVDKTGECRYPKVRLDYVGFPDLEGYLVGYGMDDRGTGRGLAHIERKV